MMAIALKLTFILLSVSYLFLIIRLIKGPTTADRVVAVDLMAIVSIGFILLISITNREPIYIDIAIALAFIAFLTTVACSRFILFEKRAQNERSD